MSNKIIYSKPYRNADELCGKIKDEGLNIANEDIAYASDILSKVSYYRFKIYLHPFLYTSPRYLDRKNLIGNNSINTSLMFTYVEKPEESRYKNNYTFRQVHELYQFDSELRSFIFNIIEKLEVSIRTSIDQWITEKSNDTFWYLNSDLFSDTAEHDKTIEKIHHSFSTSPEEFAEHYRKKYTSTYTDPVREIMPPGWVAIEVMTFGNIDKLLGNLNQQSIDDFGLDKYANKKVKIPGKKSFKKFTKQLTSIKNIRNWCCHHSRLFNRHIAAVDSIKKLLGGKVGTKLEKQYTPRGIKFKRKDNLHRIYTSLAAIQSIYSAFGYDKFGNSLELVINNHPIAKEDFILRSMGFPSDWKTQKIFFDL